MKRVISLAAILLLSACGDTMGGGSVRQTLGLNRSAPDEFKVVSRPPLSVPPEFRLTTPKPGAPPRGTASAKDQAAALILSERPEAATGVGSFTTLDDFVASADTTVTPIISEPLESAGDSLFLSKAGADYLDEGIREKLYSGDSEPLQPVDSQFAIDAWLGEDGSAEMVDPKAEAARIREAIDNETPINEGEVKTLESDGVDSLLDRLF